MMNSKGKTCLNFIGDSNNCWSSKPPRYLSLLKSWFRGVIDKDGFDFEAEKMLDPVQFKLHNRFIVCLFMKCHTLSGKEKNLFIDPETIFPSIRSRQSMNAK